jgi:transcription initiation factor TFIIIB Brf1 subunit/transcription initiation factor TFIIB
MFNIPVKGLTSCGHSFDTVVMDYTRASAICTVCGCELPNQEQSFYGNTVNDLNRVGAYDNFAWKRYDESIPQLRKKTSFSTKIDKENVKSYDIPKLKISSDEKRKLQTIEHIEHIVNVLRLNENYVELARTYYDRIESSGYKKCKKVSLLAAACVSLVIKTRRMNISFKELASACTNIKTKEIMRLNHIYSKLLSLKKHYVSLSDTISKYASLFGLDYHQEKFAYILSEFIQKYEIIPGNNPFSCISVIMYSTCSLVEPSTKKSIRRRRRAINWKEKIRKYEKPCDELIKIVSNILDISINTIRKSIIIFKGNTEKFFCEKNMHKFKIRKMDINLAFEPIK